MSPLQTQYPLSPRKFWKKFIGKLISWIIIWALVCALPSVFIWALQLGPNTAPDAGVAQKFTALLGVGLLVWSILVFGGLWLYAWYLKVYIRRYYYDAGEHFVTIKKGVFAPAEIHVMYQKIQDVYVDQDILDRIMGLYDVHLASATVTSGMEAHIDGVEFEAAEGLKTFLLTKIQNTGLHTMPATVSTGETPVAKPTPSVVTFTEDVSTKTYPIHTRWVIQQIVVGVFSSLFGSLMVSFYIFSPTKGSNESLGGAFGLWGGSWILLFILFFVGHIIWTFLWKGTYSFSFLPEYIQMKSGIIARSEVHVPYRAVQDVTVTQGVIERLFGLATVNIENAAQAQVVGRTVTKSGIQIPGQMLEQANHIAGVVRSVTLTKNTSQTGL